MDLPGRDADAIHKSTAAEISALTLKGTPAAGDHVMLESLADGNAKRRTPVSALTGSGLTAANLAGFIKGFRLIHSMDDDHDIIVSTGTCVDLAGTQTLALSASITKQLDAAWAAGSSAGGLFSGAVAADTWYHVFVIRKDSDGSIDAGFDTSLTAANIPAGYTAYRRVGSVHTDSSANIYAFFTKETAGGGLWFSWAPEHGVGNDAWLFDVENETCSTTPVTKTLHVPNLGGGNDLASKAHVLVFLNASAARASLIYPVEQSVAKAFNHQNSVTRQAGDADFQCNQVVVRANGQGSVVLVSDGNNGLFSMQTMGYEDARRT